VISNAGEETVDALVQIRLFGKLKLTKCAPVPGLPEIGFFMNAQVGKPASAWGWSVLSNYNQRFSVSGLYFQETTAGTAPLGAHP
jgi:hypothetical protein